MRKSIIIIIATIALLLGTGFLNGTKAQMYMFYDPFEMSEDDIEMTQSEAKSANAMLVSSDSTELIYVAAALWAVLGVLILRIYRIKKNKEKRIHFERIGYRNIKRAATVMLLLFLAVPAKAQIFVDEETREYTMRVNIASPTDQKPIKPILGATKDQYAPLGGEVLVLGLLGGAYLLGKKRENK